MKLAIRTICFHFLCILIFGIIYYNIQYQFQHKGEQERQSMLDYVLLSTTIQAGVGFSDMGTNAILGAKLMLGDICPLSTASFKNCSIASLRSK